MSLAFVWHSFAPDSAALALSVQSWAENFAQPGDEFTVCEEDVAPIAPAVRARLVARYGVQFRQRPAMSNLTGPGVPGAVLRALSAACGSHEAVWKVDSDALCFGDRSRALAQRLQPALFGLPYVWKNLQVARGFAYRLSAAAAASALPVVDAFSELHGPAGWGEDAVISACVAETSNQPILLPPYDPDRGFWAGWNYATNQPPARYHQTFDFVSFGNPPRNRPRRDATMRRVYDDFLASRAALTAVNQQ